MFYYVANDHLYTVKPREICNPEENEIDSDHCAYCLIEPEIINDEKLYFFDKRKDQSHYVINEDAINGCFNTTYGFTTHHDDGFTTHHDDGFTTHHDDGFTTHHDDGFTTHHDDGIIKRQITCFRTKEQALSDYGIVPSNGIFRSWHHSGVQRELTCYKNNQKHGISVFWNRSGYIMSISNYNQDRQYGWCFSSKQLTGDFYYSSIMVTAQYIHNDIIQIEYTFQLYHDFVNRTLLDINEPIPDDFERYIGLLKKKSNVYTKSKRCSGYFKVKSYENGRCFMRKNVKRDSFYETITTGRYVDKTCQGYFIDDVPCGIWLINGQVVLPNITNTHLFPRSQRLLGGNNIYLFPFDNLFGLHYAI